MSTQRPRATAVDCVAFARDVAVEYTANQECPDEYRILILKLCDSVLDVHKFHRDVMTAWVNPFYSICKKKKDLLTIEL